MLGNSSRFRAVQAAHRGNAYHFRQSLQTSPIPCMRHSPFLPPFINLLICLQELARLSAAAAMCICALSIDTLLQTQLFQVDLENNHQSGMLRIFKLYDFLKSFSSIWTFKIIITYSILSFSLASCGNSSPICSTTTTLSMRAACSTTKSQTNSLWRMFSREIPAKHWLV